MKFKNFLLLLFSLLFSGMIYTSIVVYLFFVVDPFRWDRSDLWGMKGGSEALFALFILLFTLLWGFISLEFIVRLSKGFNSRFPNHITTTKFEIKNEFLDQSSTMGHVFNEANDKQLLIKLRNRKFYIYGCGLGALLFTYLVINHYINNGQSIAGEGAVYAAFSVVFFASFLISLFYPTSVIIFNRMNGTVTFPKMLFVRNRTVPFSDVIIGDRKLMCVKHPSRATFYYIPGLLSEGYFTSFYVWYMDKNRPLPPGSLFDPYREIDFKRRQAEGFPDPLYPSSELITDDRAGYIYGDEKALKIISSSRVKVSVAYDVVITALYKQYPEIKEEEVVLIGVWQDYYVFSANASLNQPLKLFVECPPNVFLVHKDKKKVKLYI